MTQNKSVNYTVVIALLFGNLRLIFCSIFFYDFPNITNLPKIFLRSFENVGPGEQRLHRLMSHNLPSTTKIMVAAAAIHNS